MRKLMLLVAFVALLLVACQKKSDKKEYKREKHTDSKGYTYESITNDPTKTRIYTLKNGLTVFLSKNSDEPRIQTYVAVRTGSNNDPKDNTGLAHYLEHMLFKGTSKIGALNWEKESKLLQKISDLYEKHKAEKSAEKRKEIYKEIDKVSQEAAKYVATNEYDKLASGLGASGTNAHTWFDETVYENNIPSNELKKWMQVESERFSELVLRLFHTELEAVYEEFNRAQDSDFRLVHYQLLDALFPTHPYGQQTTLGTSEHLKTPSMVAIHKYFNTYYVPNNMAVILAGDLDYEKTIALVDEYFGKYETKPLPNKTFPREKPITAPIEREVFSKEPERLAMAFRFDGGTGSEDEKYLTLVDMILTNGKAGLIDLDINQAQKTLSAGCSPSIMKEYSYHNFYAAPKAGQTLEEVRDLLLAEIEKLKKGEFPDWLLDATINDMELNVTKAVQDPVSVANFLFNAFIQDLDWKKKLTFFDNLRKITKEQIVKFANEHYKDNYVIVYKRQGKNKNLIRVENPGITPVKVNREHLSDFAKDILSQEVEPIAPIFIDYKKLILEDKLNELPISYIENKDNDLFDFNIIFDMGQKNDKQLSLAISYLEYLGTDKYTAEQIKEEFYKLGISYSVSAGSEKSYITLSGLNRNMSKGLELLEHLLANVKVDKNAYKMLVERTLKTRKNIKLNKGAILRAGLMSYAIYGEKSPLRDIMSKEQLEQFSPQKLVDILKDLLNYKHRIFYYGNDIVGMKKALKEYHNFGKNKAYPEATEYQEIATGNNVYYTNYDMVQAQLMLVRKGQKFDVKNMALALIFNEYFGSGLSSIVFQEIRESKSLAYSAYAYYKNAPKKDRNDYVLSFIGTQANKLPQALDVMLDLMNNMPEATKNFESAKESALKQIASQRITKSSIFWNYESLKERDIDYDIRENLYNDIKKMTLADLTKFFNEVVKGNNYTFLLIGNEKDMPIQKLKTYGKVQKMDVDYLFNNKE